MTKIILALIIAVISADVTASNCPQFYPNNEPIVVPGTIELCNTFYVVVYDPKIKGPLFSSARMTGGKSDVERVNAFKSDARLDKSVRAETTDYKGTGFDKGHLTPAGAAKNQAGDSKGHKPFGRRRLFRATAAMPQRRRRPGLALAGQGAAAAGAQHQLLEDHPFVLLGMVGFGIFLFHEHALNVLGLFPEIEQLVVAKVLDLVFKGKLVGIGEKLAHGDGTP